MKKILGLLLSVILMTIGVAVNARTVKDNIMKEKVFYNRMYDNIKIAAEIYKPVAFDKNKKYPAIIVVHPAGGVKEQVAGLYAQKLAHKGFVTLAYDAAYQGESGGDPHYLENPASRVEDVRSSVDYLTTLPFIDKNNIGVLGICAGGGYAFNAAETDMRLKAVATVSAFDLGRARRQGLGDSMTIQQQHQKLKDAAEQRTKEANGEEITYVGYVPNSPEEFTDETPVIMQEASNYYRTERCGYPTSVNKMALQSLDRLAAFEAFQYLDTVSPRPLLLIVGSKANTIYFSEDAYNRAKDPKELYVIEGATHVDLYDKPEFVPQVVEN